MNIRYIVKEEEGIVVALIEDCYLDVIKDLDKKGARSGDLLYFDDGNFLLINNTYKGVARLADGDEWDENVGKEVAKTKAILKYVSAKQRALANFVDKFKELDIIAELDEDYIDKLEGLSF